MPEDGDDGFFPTSGNDMVRRKIYSETHIVITVLIYIYIFFCVVQKPEVVNANRKYRIRVLVCAPSNSALDEIVLRLLTTGMCFIQRLSHYLNVSVGLMCCTFRSA